MAPLPRPILVTGSQRSGTTWVGEILAAAPRIRYVHEPFNPQYRPRRDLVRCPASEHFQRVAAADAERWITYLRFRMGFDTGGATGLPAWLRSRWSRVSGVRPLLKDPIALFAAEWLARTFDAQVVILVRHPAAYVSSILRLGWRINLDVIGDPELLATDLAPLAGEIRDVISRRPVELIEEACLVWRACYLLVEGLRRRHPDWILVRNEDLSLEPERRFSELFDRLELRLGSRARRRIREYTSERNPVEAGGKVHQLRRHSAANVALWRQRLSAEEIASVRARCEEVAATDYPSAEW